jgi:hypothetical protein
MSAQTWYDLTSLLKDHPVGKQPAAPKPQPRESLEQFKAKFGL